MSTITTLLNEHQQALLFLLNEFDRVCKSLDIPYLLFAGTMLGAVRHRGFIPWDDDLDVIMLRDDYKRFLDHAETVLDTENFYLQKEFSNHWPMFFSKLRLNNTTCLEKYHPKDQDTHQGVYIDVFPCDNAAKSKVGKKVQFVCSKVVIAKSLDARGYDTDDNRKKLFIRLCRLLPMKPFLWMTKKGSADSEFVHSFLGGASGFSKSVYPRHCFDDRTTAEFEGAVYPISAQHDELLTILYGDYMKIPSVEERENKQHAILVDLHNSYEKYSHYRDGMTFETYTRSIR